MTARYRSALFAAVSAAAMVLAALTVVAQGPADSQASPPRPVHLTMEQRHIIKEIILNDMKVAPTASSVPTNIGDVVPSGVALQPVPVEVAAKIPAVKSLSFIVKDKTVLIVDPNNNKIAETID
jgi:hypothetical protein